jgi:valyl-tRNA synthetase
VRDEHGAKMSKSKGNVMDPLDLCDKFGADALRFTLMAMAAQGRDIKLSESRVEGYRNFATKLWNAARYTEMNGCLPVAGFDPATARQTVNRWIVGETVAVADAVARGIEEMRFNEAAHAIYHFAWGLYCDWYIEFSKPILAGDDEAAKAETRAVAAWVLEQILRVLHPFMPSLTEEIFAHRSGHTGSDRLITSDWPNYPATLRNESAMAEMGWVIKLVTLIRSLRSDMNVPPGAEIPLLLKDASVENQTRLARHADLIARLGRLSETRAVEGGAAAKGSVEAVLDEAVVILPIAEVIDIAAERARLEKELGRIKADLIQIDKKLGNESFVERAPPEVVEEQKSRREAALSASEKLSEALGRLAGL